MPRILDLFCGAGGAAAGYHEAGWEVIGVDIVEQPRYPFPFIRDDAITFARAHGAEYDAIHASPPCQAYSSGAAFAARITGIIRDHPDLVDEVRTVLIATGRPYVIENVIGSPLRDAVQLCGSSFALPLRRHRLFESSVLLLVPPCAHKQLPVVHLSGLGLNRTSGERLRDSGRLTRFVGVYGGTHRAGELAEWRLAMGIPWMNRREITQAIPPAYTELIGRQLLAALAVTGQERPS